VFQLDYVDSDGRRRRYRIPGLVLRNPPERAEALRKALGPLRREARRYAEALHDQLRAARPLPGLPRPPNPLTLRQALEADRERPGVADRTRAWEARHAARLLRVIPETLPVEALTAGHLNRHVAAHGHQAARTINMDLQILRAMLNRLVRDGALTAAPCAIRMLPDDAPSPPSRALTEGQLVALLAECQGRGIYDEVGFLANTGLRWSEFWGLRWGQIDFQSATLTLVTHKRGRASAVRTDRLPLNAAALAILQSRAAVPEGNSTASTPSTKSTKSTASTPSTPPDPDLLIFGVEPAQRRGTGSRTNSKSGAPGRKDGTITYERWQFRARFKAAARAAGIPDPERLRPHDLRHTFATLLLRLPGATVPDVAALLRHRNPIVTLRVYCHPHADAARALVNQLPTPKAR
jgi:integrase